MKYNVVRCYMMYEYADDIEASSELEAIAKAQELDKWETNNNIVDSYEYEAIEQKLIRLY